jgi:hypothetical protein
VEAAAVEEEEEEEEDAWPAAALALSQPKATTPMATVATEIKLAEARRPTPAGTVRADGLIKVRQRVRRKPRTDDADDARPMQAPPLAQPPPPATAIESVLVGIYAELTTPQPPPDKPPPTEAPPSQLGEPPPPGGKILAAAARGRSRRPQIRLPPVAALDSAHRGADTASHREPRGIPTSASCLSFADALATAELSRFREQQAVRGSLDHLASSYLTIAGEGRPPPVAAHPQSPPLHEPRARVVGDNEDRGRSSARPNGLHAVREAVKRQIV